MPNEDVVVATYSSMNGFTWLPPMLHFGSHFSNFTHEPEASFSQCVKLQLRAANGVLSGPVSRCGSMADAPLELSGSTKLACTSGGITQDGQVVSPPSGCSVSAGRVSTSRSTWIAGVLALATALARITRPRA